MSRNAWGRWVVPGLMMLLFTGTGSAAAGQQAGSTPPASDSALTALIHILRERNLISTEEFERLRTALQPPPASPVPQGNTPAPAFQADAASRASDVTQAVAAALENKWYERISLRGYSQFRSSEVLSHEGAPVEVPADRSVNENETFVLRRGRFIFSGDVTDRLYLYAQSDFNASTGSGVDFSLQMRDLYADLALNKTKTWRIRLGQSKVPFGFANMQSSQNRLALERPDAINGAAEGERDYGAYLMWAPAAIRTRFRDLVSRGLKGSGDYGVVAVGAYSGQGLNRSDANGIPHVLGRVSYPLALSGGQLLEIGVQGYRGRFVSPVQAISPSGTAITPLIDEDGAVDQRVGATFVLYPQPFGIEAEWNVGWGPELSDDRTRIDSRRLNGGYLQAAYRTTTAGVMLPFARWQYFDGGRKFARNAPRNQVNEVDFGLEWAPRAEIELTGIYTRTIRRTRTSTYPYGLAEDANRIGIQVQWNY